MDSFKGQDVYVTVGKTLHGATIESLVPEEQGHVVVHWAINRKRETVDL